MFRAVLASIVLTLTLGQNVVLLCHVWCYPPHGANSSCEHQVATTSTSLTEDESCAQLANGTALFVREEARMPASASDVLHTTVVARFQVVPPPCVPAAGFEHTQGTPPETRPLVLALRI